ncbi:MFS transporter [Halanaerobium sp. Z-7514]|uniref:MFS transporter n=1 Tax=Halanaerobium polyolivorans TaxID=2886943 RepID=A0AAW4WXW7_9FIRM|nr:MFS transporter [Halanaerobium polyolivorans]MCC3144284.1 MFS transporter [Halanaerobium polyolivorans]RQD74698.1 MAG: MFS transporter [Halanaerobium sp. MSAO_Bac5]
MQLFLVIIMGTFGVMGGALVAPGLPTIGAAFGVEGGTVGLILSVYTISAAFSLPILGYLIDRLGRKKVGLACLIIDGSFGLLSVFSPSFGLLLLCRFFQGIGVAGLIPVAMTIIGDLYDGDERLNIMGYLTGTLSLGAVVIPLLGGFLVYIDWRLPFVVYGFSLFLAVFFYIFIPETAPALKDNPDKEALENRDTSLKKYILSLVEVLKIRSIVEIFGYAFITYFLLYTVVTFVPIFLNNFHGFGENIAGIALSIQGMFSAIIASRAKLFKNIRWKFKVGGGFVLIASALLLFPIWAQGNILVLLSVVIFGLGMGLLSPVVYDRATDLPPKELSGSVIALFNTMKYIGMSTSPALLGLLVNFISIQAMFSLVGVVVLAGTLIMLIRTAALN